jgi:hypothetical protein
MKKLFILIIIPLIIYALAAYSDTIDGDNDYARLGKTVTFTALTDTGYTDAVEVRSQVWNTVGFFLNWVDIDDTCTVYFEGSVDNTTWNTITTKGYNTADSANASTSEYYTIFENANMMNYYRIRVLPDSTINVIGSLVIGSK